MDKRKKMTVATVQRMDSRIDLGHLPVSRVKSGFRVAGTLVCVIGVVILLVVAGFLFCDCSSIGVLLPFAGAGLFFFLLGIHVFIWRKEVMLDADRVSLRIRGVIGAKAWDEPLETYEGVMIRSKWVAGQQQRSERHQVFLVELKHQNPERTVEIFEADRDEGWHATWRDVSIRFHLPAMEESPDGVVERPPEDLQKTVHDMVREGRLDIAFDPSVPPPSGLFLQARDGGLELRVPHRNWHSPALWGGVAASLVVMAWLVVLMASGVYSVLLAVGSVLYVVTAVLLLVVFLSSQARLQIGPERVVTSVMTPMGERRRQEVEKARIGGVEIGEANRQHGKLCLHILADDRRIYFGTGLSRPALEWLRNCLLAALTRL